MTDTCSTYKTAKIKSRLWRLKKEKLSFFIFFIFLPNAPRFTKQYYFLVASTFRPIFFGPFFLLIKLHIDSNEYGALVGKILPGENRSNRRKTCPGAKFSTAKLTRTGPGSTTLAWQAGSKLIWPSKNWKQIQWTYCCVQYFLEIQKSSAWLEGSQVSPTFPSDDISIYIEMILVNWSNNPDK
jgi:hypothetical protein